MTRGEWGEERKIVCGCACVKRQGRTSERPHRNILQRFNWSILEEERDVRAAEAFILICAWLGRLGGRGRKANRIKRSSKRYKKNGILQHLCRLAIISWLLFHYKTTGDSPSVTFKMLTIPEFLSNFPHVQVRSLKKTTPIISPNNHLL